jgi:hypothetical protein
LAEISESCWRPVRWSETTIEGAEAILNQQQYPQTRGVASCYLCGDESHMSSQCSLGQAIETDGIAHYDKNKKTCWSWGSRDNGEKVPTPQFRRGQVATGMRREYDKRAKASSNQAATSTPVTQPASQGQVKRPASVSSTSSAQAIIASDMSTFTTSRPTDKELAYDSAHLPQNRPALPPKSTTLRQVRWGIGNFSQKPKFLFSKI